MENNEDLKNIETVELKVSELNNQFGNPRKIDKKGLQNLEESLDRFGDFGVIVIDENNSIISGNQRVAVLKKKDPETKVLCKRLVGYSTAEKRAINIKSNRHEGVDDWEKMNEWLSELTEDLRIGYLTTDSTPRPFGYDQPFGFSVGSSGAFKIINRQYYKAQMDHDVFYCCDIDCVLQELIANRIVLHPKYFLARAKIDKNAGGLSSTRVRSAVMNSVAAMENKWGQYFSYNFVSNTPNIKVKR